MSDFHIGGCAGVSATRYFYYKFSIDSLVYFVPKAKQGVLEPHVVKEVASVIRFGNYMQPEFLYKDTLNALFNEDELCSEADAIDYAKAFYADAIAELNTLIQSKECQ